MVERELKELGFTQNETRIYLALLRHGTLNPTRIAEKTGLHRSYVYDTAERLLERGLISTVLVNGRKHFQAADPRTLQEAAELKLRTAQTVMPQLSALYRQKKEDASTELQRGMRVYRTLIKELTANMREKDTVLLIGVDERILETVEPIYLKQYFTILREKHAGERVIIAKGGKRLREKGLVYRQIDREYIGRVVTVIHRDTTYFFIEGNPHRLVTVKDADVAESHRRHFELLWTIAKR